MSNYREIAKCQLMLDEGMGRHVYKDTMGVMTLGYGRNVDASGPGISDEEAEYLLDNDLTACISDLQVLFTGWQRISEARKAVLVNLRFQLGASGFRSFRKMIAAINREEWREAAVQLRDSELMTQCPKRTERRAQELERESA